MTDGRTDGRSHPPLELRFPTKKFNSSRNNDSSGLVVAEEEEEVMVVVVGYVIR